MTQACIRIQARYRTHYIIKKKRVLAATTIQRFARGFLVRWRRKRTVAATRMQASAERAISKIILPPPKRNSFLSTSIELYVIQCSTLKPLEATTVEILY